MTLYQALYRNPPQAFFDSQGVLRDWQTCGVLPAAWTGIARYNDTLFQIGHEDGERTFTALPASSGAAANVVAACAAEAS